MTIGRSAVPRRDSGGKVYVPSPSSMQSPGRPSATAVASASVSTAATVRRQPTASGGTAGARTAARQPTAANAPIRRTLVRTAPEPADPVPVPPRVVPQMAAVRLAGRVLVAAADELAALRVR